MMFTRIFGVWTVLMLLACVSHAGAPPAGNEGGREFYAAPTGAPHGDGSRNAPWNLKAVLADRTALRPGDTLWLLPGVYPGLFTSRIEGTAERPILVRAVPGARATLCKTSADDNVGTLTVRGDYVWFRDLEITNRYPDRNRLDPEKTVDPWRGSAVNIFSRGVRLINCVLHDAGHGVGLWNQDGGAEIYGCLMYYNGNNKKEHGVYGHNRTGTHRIADNVIFHGAGYGLHLYANSMRGSLNGLEVEGNIVFNNGSLTTEDQAADQIQVGGVKGIPARRIVLRDNYVYVSEGLAATKNRGLRLGYEDEGNEDVVLTGNYVAARMPLRVWWWQQVTATGNTFRTSHVGAELRLAGGGRPGQYRWKDNTYVCPKAKAPVFTVGSEQRIGFARWKQLAQVDTDSKVLSAPLPKSEQLRVFVRPNRYESGRAHIAVFNWEKQPEVSVDVAGVLRAGESYVVLDAQNFHGKPVLAGVYDGNPLRLPMQLREVQRPLGNVERVPEHTGPEFAAFVLLRRETVPAAASRDTMQENTAARCSIGRRQLTP